ncbi:MAG: ribosome maturation factor RimP [Cobetia sp.]|uniref:Ribosome maturation factor RimP n=1 Tax=Cobetia amphilecti TaxID=1055104 RepID=A0AAP4WYI3_9GAMM|nr:MULTISPECIES: ribosome maturation factor RimP [Cobetia]AVV33999.1 ribosome maturation factor RimP [Halomonas sp. SF2003]MBR9754958.1 ribosome maturation factor RimP [Gammaproteobacteria bacterium]MBS4153723.1 ribosome maturation factor RimP [Cobetia sp. MC34]MCK8069186.1 ribosome maturation factor RimP [Cobetia sp. 1CM21F]NHH85989.1 Ribosome maturation factor RimP [Cobetia sp. MB87]TCJ24646.1 ribosome maturation factor RimP [Halomonas sp. GDM18]
MSTKDAALNALIDPVVSALGFELWGIDYLSQGKQSRLVIYIDHPDGITVDNCANVSRQVGAVLDVEDPITGQFQLEVSSPGMDRPLFTLDQYERYIGHVVALRLRQAFDGQRKFQGLVTGTEDGDVVIRVDEEEYCFPIESIDQARIVPQFK